MNDLLAVTSVLVIIANVASCNHREPAGFPDHMLADPPGGSPEAVVVMPVEHPTREVVTEPESPGPPPRASTPERPSENRDSKESSVREIPEMPNSVSWEDEVGAAVHEYEKALTTDKLDDRAHLGLGTAYFELEQTSLAIHHLKTAVEINPRNGQAWVVLGDAYKAIGDLDNAKVAYERYLDIEPQGKYRGEVQMIVKVLE